MPDPRLAVVGLAMAAFACWAGRGIALGVLRGGRLTLSGYVRVFALGNLLLIGLGLIALGVSHDARSVVRPIVEMLVGADDAAEWMEWLFNLLR